MNTEIVNIKEIREVVEIKRMFDHIHMSADILSYPKADFKFFGFPEGTTHYTIFRNLTLDELELSMEWRYRDQNPNGLQRCQMMLTVYKAITTPDSRSTQKPLSEQQLDGLVVISKETDRAA